MKMSTRDELRAFIAFATSILLVAYAVVAITSTPSRDKRSEEVLLFSRHLLFKDGPGASTPSPTPSPKKCFDNTTELYDAVDKFMEGSNEAELSATYGLPMGTWKVSGIQNFSFMFTGLIERNLGSSAINLTRVNFNEDISAWDVSSATTMNFMFLYASSFNQNLSAWSTSKVTDMRAMFGRASSFNQDLSLWDVSKVSNMEGMFSGAGSFNDSLCLWKHKLRTDVSVANMFLDTACPNWEENDGTPNLTASQPGPFCQACN
jgi:surface protein